MSYMIKPIPCFLDKFTFYKVLNGRKTYRSDYKYYQWDELHGEIEVYNKRGRHLGVLHSITGDKIKEAIKGRKLDV